ncbi:hypothetical protein AK812_SmicGene44557 [Symbiodinium microadriaticum]|uniref:Uncharacterized protein n=1 Tax=Symbiodinium microadriaticum TaxID=2951 RepID=A0A1Q9BY54_SYMMI|nr:hypothetical protein AK812_SmicGene44557 [Symbiodinium microadriaticum]
MEGSGDEFGVFDEPDFGRSEGEHPFPPLPPVVPKTRPAQLPPFLRSDSASLASRPATSDFLSNLMAGQPLVSKPQLPWERGPMAKVFGMDKPKPLQPTRVGVKDFHLQTIMAPPPVQGPKAGHEFGAMRAYYATRIKTDDELRFKALQRFRVLLISEPTASVLGDTLWEVSSQMGGDNEASSVVMDAFAGRATGTLVKYSAAYWRYATWVTTNRVGTPLRLSETLVYRYICHLRDSKCGATAASTFLQSVSYLYKVARVKEPSVDFLMSSRIRGAARDGEYLTLVAGHLCFCLYAYLNSIIQDATSKEKKTTFLPLLALGVGLEPDEPWAYGWQEAREALPANCEWALPAYSWNSGKFLSRGLSTGEASFCLREILANGGIPPSECWKVSSHSLKSTLLSWCSKSAKVTFEDRRLLGHHVDRNAASPLCYSRDECTRLAALVYGVLHLIRTGVLDPDLPRVMRLKALVEQGETLDRHTVVDHDEPVSEVGSEDCASEDLEDELDSLSSNLPGLPPPSAQDEEVVKHVLSGVLHFKVSGDRLKCGGPLNSNYVALEGELLPDLHPQCIQCLGNAA